MQRDDEGYEVVVVERAGWLAGEGLLQLLAEVGLRRLKRRKPKRVSARGSEERDGEVRDGQSGIPFQAYRRRGRATAGGGGGGDDGGVVEVGGMKCGERKRSGREVLRFSPSNSR